MAWPKPHCEPFRELLVHPSVKPYLEGILGMSYRLDHGGSLLAMDPGAEGGTLHGGGTERTEANSQYAAAAADQPQPSPSRLALPKLIRAGW